MLKVLEVRVSSQELESDLGALVAVYVPLVKATLAVLSFPVILDVSLVVEGENS